MRFGEVWSGEVRVDCFTRGGRGTLARRAPTGLTLRTTTRSPPFFCMRQFTKRAYLKDPWNILDFIIVR